MDPRPWYDTALLAWIAAFFLLEGGLLDRRTWLGWAMLGKCLAMAALFVFGVLVMYFPWLRTLTWYEGTVGPWHVEVGPVTVLRLVAAAAITVAVAGLLWYRTHGARPDDGSAQ